MQKSYLMAAGAAVAALGLAACEREPPTGLELYQDYCAACHGADAKGGDGVLDKHWPKPPANLTKLAHRHGGIFPTGYVMSTVDGYTRNTHDEHTMPAFGPLLEGEMAVWVDENGVPTPTPAALLALAEYIASLQE
jgi:mono/diheme cytochrome c family protein